MEPGILPSRQLAGRRTERACLTLPNPIRSSSHRFPPQEIQLVSNIEQIAADLDANFSSRQRLPPMEPEKLGQTVLVVDDDWAIRKFVKMLLESEGYDLLTADGAASAMELYDHSPVALLLTDVVMPNIDGPKLADLLLQREPQLRVLFMSGSENVSRGYGCVAKPFTGTRLIRRIGQVLESLPSTSCGRTAAA